MITSDEGAYHKLSVPAQTQPTGCPIDHEFTTFTDDYLANPYPQLAKIREQHPIFYSKKLGYLVVTRMEDLIDIFRDHKVYSSANVQNPVFPICDRAARILAHKDFNPVAVMSNRQQPDHTRIRKYTQEGFSGRRMKILEPYTSPGASPIQGPTGPASRRRPVRRPARRHRPSFVRPAGPG